MPEKFSEQSEEEFEDRVESGYGRRESKKNIEDLMGPDGKVDFKKIISLQDAFDIALKAKRITLEQTDFRDDDSASYYMEMSSNADEQFNKACTVLLNTLDKSEDPQVNINLFFNLRPFLAKAQKDRGEFFYLESVYDRMIEQYPKMEQCLEEGNVYPMELMANMAKYGNQEQADNGFEFIIKNLPTVEKFLQNPRPVWGPYGLAEALRLVLKDDTQEHVKQVTDMIKKVLENPTIAASGTDILGNMLHGAFNEDELPGWGAPDPKIISAVKDIFMATLQSYHIDEATARAWTQEWVAPKKRTPSEELPEEFHVKGHTDLRACIDLEARKPGITKILYQKYGISNFGRYPINMLLQQVENMDNTKDPYGVILFPKEDYNGAFYQDRYIFSDLMRQFSESPYMSDYLLRVYECGSKKELARALIDLDQSYGQTQKIAFAIIGGHGTADSIKFGEGNSDRNTLWSNDLHSGRVQGNKDFFEPGATVILVSCSTGENRGIGQTLSKKFGMKVIAPTEPTNLRSINPKFTRGAIDFDVEYAKEGTEAVYKP